MVTLVPECSCGPIKPWPSTIEELDEFHRILAKLVWRCRWMQRVPAQNICDEIEGDVLLRLFERYRRDQSNPETYLVRVVWGLILNLRRYRGIACDPADPKGILANAVDFNLGPEARLSEEETRDLFLRPLPPHQRRVVEMWLDGYDQKEIAAAMGIAYGTARQWLLQARSIMKDNPRVAEYFFGTK